MMSKAEVLEWVQSLPTDAEIGISDGGLALEVMVRAGSETSTTGAWLEIGGMPEGVSEL